MKDSTPVVYLIGAGPGDAGLISVKAVKLLSRAEVVIYDNLVNKELLKFVPKNSEIIYAGKKAGAHSMTQSEINALIVEKAREGKIVLRLKGGDPFIFGRGGEEAEILSAEGIPFEVVPGITSAIAVPAYAGIPLTHRDYTSTVAFITGHEKEDKAQSRINWEMLSKGVDTLVFLMGVGNLRFICETLIKYGKPENTPVAVIENGTLPYQRTTTGTLKTIPEIAKKKGIKPPAIIVVGGVVDLRATLNWFEKKPLFGRKILITRATEQAGDMVRHLSELGAYCIEFPTIEIVPPPSWEPLDSAIKRLREYHWIVFTSINGVISFFERLLRSGYDVRHMGGIKVAAIGKMTSAGLKQRGVIPDLVPTEFRAEALVEELIKNNIRGKRVLIPRALHARELLPVELKNAGAVVDVVPAYETVRPSHPDSFISEILELAPYDFITFTSSSTVRNFVSFFEGRQELLKEITRGAKIACIGPITSKTAEELGLHVHILPEQYTIESLVSAIKTESIL